jgi:tetratricopeptide (TPR) repeat protein
MIKKILILSANPKNTHRLRLDEEVREIEEGLRRSKKRDEFKIFTQVAVRLRDLRRAMLEYEPHIVHFSGHGGVQGIMLEDETGNAVIVSPDALAGLFELFKDTVVCVLLNSCYSESQATAINKHIPYVIGMSHAIPDEAALEFAIGFYDALGAGKPINEAFRFGSNAVQLFGFPDHLTPVLKEKTNQFLEQKRERGEEITEDLAIQYMYKFAQDNAQPGNWAGYNRLAAEIGNLMWAVGEAYKLEQWKRVLEFRQLLGDFLYWRGFWKEALQIGRWSFDAADKINDNKEKAWCALYPLARVHFYQGDYKEAEIWSEQSLALFKQEKDNYGIAAASRYLGRSLQAQGNLERAQRLFADGLRKARLFNETDPQKNLQGHLLAALASIDFDEGKYVDAQSKCDEALTIYKGTKDQAGIAEMSHQLGRIAFQLGNFDQAEQLFEDSLKTVETIHSEQMEAEVFYSQAVLAEKQGDLELALEKVQYAIERFQNLHANDALVRAKKLLKRVRKTLGN